MLAFGAGVQQNWHVFFCKNAGWLEDYYFPFWNGPFSGDIFVHNFRRGWYIHPLRGWWGHFPGAKTSDVTTKVDGASRQGSWQDARSKVQVFNRFWRDQSSPRQLRHLGLRTTMISYVKRSWIMKSWNQIPTTLIENYTLTSQFQNGWLCLGGFVSKTS